MRFLVVTDVNYVTSAVNTDQILAISLYDNGLGQEKDHYGWGRPRVSIMMIDGMVINNIVVPVDLEAVKTDNEVHAAVKAWFDKLETS